MLAKNYLRIATRPILLTKFRTSNVFQANLSTQINESTTENDSCEADIRMAMNPITGRQHNVVKVLSNPQFKDYDIVQCLDTGMQWTDPLPTITELEYFYSVVYNNAYGRDLSESAVIPDFVTRRAQAQVAFILKHSPDNVLDADTSHVVEVGAGWGSLSRTIKPLVHQVDAFELDPESVGFINNIRPMHGVRAYQGALEDDNDYSIIPKASVDLIVSSMMLEHVLFPRTSLIEWRTRLVSGGLLFIEVPNENPVPNWWGRDPADPYWVGHLTFFSLPHLTAMLESTGYKVLAGFGFDHTASPGYVQQGDSDDYQLPTDVSEDSTPSKSPNPRLIRVLAQKI